jgi:hypothetical protein
MIVLAALFLAWFGCCGTAIYLGHVKHLTGHRLHVVIVLGVVGQLAGLLVPVALMYG